MSCYFQGKKFDSFEESFWSKVDKKGPDDCWEWIAARHPRGYGNLCAKPPFSRKAHRTAWLLANGEIPSGLNVCHKCDNPACCNPHHLFLGTQKDNMLDCVKKKRWPTIFTQEQIVEIRRLYLEEDMTQAEIGILFNTNNKIISDIVRGHSWKWTEYFPDNPKCKPRQKIQRDQIRVIFQLHEDGLMNKEIAVRYGVDPSTISKMISQNRRQE